jgi:hypothetical protein
MKTAVVPAQITTLEDKVAGGLGLTQLILLVIPVFLSGVVYGILSPAFSLSPAKIILIILLFVTIGSLAIKIKGVLLMNWLLILGRYMARPGFYVYDKNSSAARSNDSLSKQKHPEIVPSSTEPRQKILTPALPPHEQFAIETLMSHPASNLHFKTDKKGNLHVAISKAE